LHPDRLVRPPLVVAVDEPIELPMPIPSLSYHTDSWLRPKMALTLAKGRPLSVRMARGKRQPRVT
jgi:hypothetical protein